MSTLHSFIEKGRAKNTSDKVLKERLLAAGWQEPLIDAVLEGNEVPLPPTQSYGGELHVKSMAPVAVSSVASQKGFEYLLMFIALWAVAASFMTLLNFAIRGDMSGGVAAFPVTILLVGLPIFAFFFLRLKKAELKDPDLRKDASRRRALQITQLVTFGAVVIHLVTLLYGFIRSCDQAVASYSYSTCDKSDGKDVLHFLVTLVIAGGIFLYYWFDERNTAKK
jgi:hypothetical protein